jgi:hypothetical protein
VLNDRNEGFSFQFAPRETQNDRASFIGQSRMTAILADHVIDLPEGSHSGFGGSRFANRLNASINTLRRNAAVNPGNENGRSRIKARKVDVLVLTEHLG